MKLDLSCPIEVRGYTLTWSDRSMQAAVRLYNLTNRSIESFDAVVRWHSSAENRKIVCPFSMERVHARGEDFFQITLKNNRLPGADRLEILFSTVRFEDGNSEWHSGNGPYAEINPLPPLSTAEQGLLKAAAGQDAVCWPEQNDHTWLCPCGRMNPTDAAACARCHRSRDAVLTVTPENARMYAEHASAAEEATESMPVLEQRFIRRRSRLMQRTLLITVAALVVTAFFVVREQPAANRGALNASATVIETVAFKN